MERRPTLVEPGRLSRHGHRHRRRTHRRHHRSTKRRQSYGFGVEVQGRGVGDPGVGVAGVVVERGRVDVDVVAGTSGEFACRVNGDLGGAGAGDLAAGDGDRFNGCAGCRVADGDVSDLGVDGFAEPQGDV